MTDPRALAEQARLRARRAASRRDRCLERLLRAAAVFQRAQREADRLERLHGRRAIEAESGVSRAAPRRRKVTRRIEVA